MAIIGTGYLSKCLSHAIDGEIEVPSSQIKMLVKHIHWQDEKKR